MCNCRSNNSYRNTPPHTSRPVSRAIPTQVVKTNTNQTSQPNPAPNVANFCRICGWLLKKSRYVDAKTKAIVERIQCTNLKCSTRR